LEFESYNLQSKNLPHKGVFRSKNALKLAYEHFNSNNFSGVIPVGPVKEGGEGRGEEGLHHSCCGMDAPVGYVAWFI